VSQKQIVTKYHLLSRRVSSLPVELDTWIDQAATDNALEKNFSQIRAVERFVRILCDLNASQLSQLNLSNTEVFLDSAFRLADNVIKSHSIWDFFRDRLEQRLIPRYRDPLLMADLISHDCYTTIVDRAKALDIVLEQGFREHPLIGLYTRLSPSTWSRHRRPPALQNHRLPIPVIDLPWDHMVNPWELLTIAHEVGHDVDQDLGQLTNYLRRAIHASLKEEQTLTSRIIQWEAWTSEILADVIGILLTGLAFVSALLGLITLPRNWVLGINPADPHPPHYLRAFINTVLLRHLGLSQSADVLDASWKAIYGDPGPDFAPYLSDIEPVLVTILDTPLVPLADSKGHLYSLAELVVFTPDEQTRIEETAAKLIRGTSKRLPIRHLISASQLAFERLIEVGKEMQLDDLADHTQKIVLDFAPPGQLPAHISSRTMQHLEKQARAVLDLPLGDFGMAAASAGGSG
jgi:hypothetical protein